MNKVYCVFFATSNVYCDYEKILSIFKNENDAKQYMNKCVEEDKLKIEKDVTIKIKSKDTKVIFENIETGDYHEYYICEMDVK